MALCPVSPRERYHSARNTKRVRLREEKPLVERLRARQSASSLLPSAITPKGEQAGSN
jgi:hypothetical protein